MLQPYHIESTGAGPWGLPDTGWLRQNLVILTPSVIGTEPSCHTGRVLMVVAGKAGFTVITITYYTSLLSEIKQIIIIIKLAFIFF